MVAGGTDDDTDSFLTGSVLTAPCGSPSGFTASEDVIMRGSCFSPSAFSDPPSGLTSASAVLSVAGKVEEGLLACSSISPVLNLSASTLVGGWAATGERDNLGLEAAAPSVGEVVTSSLLTSVTSMLSNAELDPGMVTVAGDLTLRVGDVNCKTVRSIIKRHYEIRQVQ